MLGALATSKGLTPPTGLLTETPLFEPLHLRPFSELVFGGYDLRKISTLEAVKETFGETEACLPSWLGKLKKDFARIDKEVLLGTLRNSGQAIRNLEMEQGLLQDKRRLAEIVADLRKDLRAFRKRNKLDRVLVVNLGSTEPPLELDETHQSLKKLESAIRRNAVRKIRPSLLYSYAAALENCPFLHFTPSNATLVPAIQELFLKQELPFTGKDGKTGETLVKSALAPMFKYRNLRVLSWQGYNILGDRDGKILNHQENLKSKIQTKDSVLSSILGYALHTHVGIDYVPSIGDRKTAWDFIHFEGFLGQKMRMQFTWEGIDSILAAPLVLDMCRLLDHAAERKEKGSLPYLACFFKAPIGGGTNDLHAQWHKLERYVRDSQ
jgi:myo-inositol-1-phosphate synthase